MSPDPWESPPAVPLSRKQLRGLQRRTNAHGLRYAAGHTAVALATAAIIFAAWGTWWVLPAMFAHGAVLVFLFAPMHECTHGTAFRSRRLNRVVAAACGFVLMRPAIYFRYRHAAHHSYTQDPARDPDLVPMPADLRGYFGEVLGAQFWPKMIGTLYRSVTGRFNEREKRFLPDSERGRVRREAAIMVGLYALIAAAAAATGAWLYVGAYWLLPRVLAEPVLRLVRIAEHTGMEEGPDPITNTRTTLTNRVVRFLYWNMPYHAEHHLAPSVPFHALPEMHRVLPEIPEMPVASGYFNVHREILRGLGRRPAEPAERQAA